MVAGAGGRRATGTGTGCWTSVKFQLRKLNRALEVCKLVLIGSGTIVYVKIVRRVDLMLFF